MRGNRLVIASRGSALALWQANHVRDRLAAQSSELEIEILTLKTRGDRILDVPLSKVGGKALFVKEIEHALLDGRADVAVHSMKDVPNELAPGLAMAAVSEREDPRDAWLSRSGLSLMELSAGSVVGTSSLRRQCQVLSQRPDLEIKMLRGNVPTRVQKLDDGEFDAIILAAAGLNRLGHGDRITELLDPKMSLPAVGQGALGIETRLEDRDTSSLVEAALHSKETAACVAAERGFLNELGGSCQTPLAAYARIVAERLEIDALIGRPDGTEILRAQRSGTPADADSLGRELASELREQGGAAILEDLTK